MKTNNELLRWVILLLLLTPAGLLGQNRKDSVAKSADGLTAFKNLIPDSAQTYNGLFRIHRVKSNFYLEVPDSMLSRPFLLVNRISKGAAEGQSETTGYAGDMVAKVEVQFIKGPENKIFLQKLHTLDRSKDSSENGMWRAIDRSAFPPLLMAFDLKSISPAGSGIIDLTAFLLNDNEITGFDMLSRSKLGIKSFFPERSFINRINAYSTNIEIKTVKSYSRLIDLPMTYEFNLSVVMLPQDVMRSRPGDKRIGYFEVIYRDFESNPQRVHVSGRITRWRIEPKPEDIPRYLKGELVEPRKPIVFYIDPATPKKWVCWLIKGVNDWQKAFEKAGFKNAIYALEAPVNDSAWNLEDARHNAIVYKPSEIMNASGPHVSDPRSGEILESHVNWYHNILALLQEWYFVQAAAVDPQARKLPLNDSLMGKLIRFVCAHEVGHTLGLRHNFGASSAYPVDSLRNKKWVMENGHTPSIMDYARFNYVAQPGDGFTQDDLIPGIGVYDEWAIEYGYRWFPPMPESEEDAVMKHWLGEKINADSRLWFGTEETSLDSRCQSEDLGDNPAIAGEYGIRNLKYIMKNLIAWTAGDEGIDNYEELRRMNDGIWKQYNRYLNHAADQIGGGLITYRTRMQKGKVIDFVDRNKQKEALAFLNKELFVTPEWLITPDIFALAGGQVALFRIGSAQGEILNRILSENTFTLLSFSQENAPEKAYDFSELLNDLNKYIWSELSSRKPIDAGRRNLQKRYVERIGALLSAKKEIAAVSFNSDFLSILKAHTKELERKVRAARSGYPDKQSLLHLDDVQERLKRIPEQKN
ncbi:MAG: zinc-dependent metalloprotease [Pseudobacter sp.]|uniref:zinc-dependent metalloprotease n=1 Tax=Pseudobacter sp. TaxID=2045420 RepID=UPI003F7F232B